MAKEIVSFIGHDCHSADSNIPFIPQDQYALKQKLFTMTNLMKLYMFLMATKDQLCFHGNQYDNFKIDSAYDNLLCLCFYSNYIYKIGIRFKYIEQPISLYQKIQMSSFAYS